mgnify:FL=1
MQAIEGREDAQILFDNGRYRAAVNRLYYVFFWLVRGLLTDEGIFAKKHSGAQIKFAEYFIKTERIPKLYYDYLVELFESRMDADYDFDEVFIESEVVAFIEKTDEFIDFVKTNFSPDA